MAAPLVIRAYSSVWEGDVMLAEDAGATYSSINSAAWDYLAEHGCDSCQPYGEAELASPASVLDPDGWIPWEEVKSVLCLAAGGGQQAPLFAVMGRSVTSADLCEKQLERDHWLASQAGVEIETIRADMLDLAVLHGRDFDLVYQAVSACYVPDVRKLYQEIGRVLRPHGLYRVEHWNPLHVQLCPTQSWDGTAYRISRSQNCQEPMPWAYDGDEGSSVCWHYIHGLRDLIGGVCEAGFAVEKFTEPWVGSEAAQPGSHEHLAAFLPPFIRMLARRR
jgi:SAM-dependent methyltransferase